MHKKAHPLLALVAGAKFRLLTRRSSDNLTLFVGRCAHL